MNMKKVFQSEIVWRNVLFWLFIHCFAVVGLMNSFRVWNHFLFHFLFGEITSFGVVCGAHRLWSHRSYKANKPLQILLMMCFTICGQNDIITWVRDHRVHHAFSDTDADPTNSKRGFFFSHMGWLMCKKHRDVSKLGKTVDISDIEGDALLIFQRRYFFPMFITLSVILPMLVSVYVIQPSLSPLMAFCSVCGRYAVSLHTTWLINSASHNGSGKPYDKNIAASDSKVYATFTYGEGWHNFHHTFPWDYRVSDCELYRHNFGMAFIDFFAWLGWATNLKKASEKAINERVLKTGDGSHPHSVKRKKF